MTKETIFLVVKCGNINSHHAAIELDKVIKNKGFAWFAKYGAKIKMDTVKLDDPLRQYALCVCLYVEKKYSLFTYQIDGFETKHKPKDGTYPNYYNDQIEFINTWIKVSPYSGTTPTVNELVIKSSLNRLSNALRKSTSGHFFCRK